jgi:hypothetical protein
MKYSLRTQLLSQEKKWLSEQIKIKTDEKSMFLISEERFNLIKKLAQYQLPFIALSNGSLTAAIYNSYTLVDQYPDDAELRKVIPYALF